MQLLCILQEDVYAQCFTDDVTLIGNYQQMTLSLILQPGQSAEYRSLCSSPNNTRAEFTVQFSKPIASFFNAQTGKSDTLSGSFTYIANETNKAVIDLKTLEMTEEQFLQMTLIKSAAYTVKLQFLELVQGHVSQIKYAKSDVSNCWQFIDFRFSLATNEEFFGFRLVPQECQLPAESLPTVKMMLRVENMTDNTKFYDIEFDAKNAPNSNGFKLPYDHMNVLEPTMYCADLQAESQAQCLDLVNLILNHDDWVTSVVVQYQVGETVIELAGDVNRKYEAMTSVQCAVDSDLKVTVFKDKAQLTHDKYSNIESCNTNMEKADHIVYLVKIHNGSYAVRHSGNITADEYYSLEQFEYLGDYSPLVGSKLTTYSQFFAYDKNDVLVSLWTIYDSPNVSKFQQVAAYINKYNNDIKIVIRKTMTDNLKAMNATDRIRLIDRKTKQVYIDTGSIEIGINTNFIQTINLRCSNMPTAASCSKNLRKAFRRSLRGNTEIVINGENSYFSNEVYRDDIVVGLLIPVIFLVLFFAGGMVLLVVYFKKKKSLRE